MDSDGFYEASYVIKAHVRYANKPKIKQLVNDLLKKREEMFILLNHGKMARNY